MVRYSQTWLGEHVKRKVQKEEQDQEGLENTQEKNFLVISSCTHS